MSPLTLQLRIPFFQPRIEDQWCHPLIFVGIICSWKVLDIFHAPWHFALSYDQWGHMGFASLALLLLNHSTVALSISGWALGRTFLLLVIEQFMIFSRWDKSVLSEVYLRQSSLAAAILDMVLFCFLKLSYALINSCFCWIVKFFLVGVSGVFGVPGVLGGGNSFLRFGVLAFPQLVNKQN